MKIDWYLENRIGIVTSGVNPVESDDDIRSLKDDGFSVIVTGEILFEYCRPACGRLLPFCLTKRMVVKTNPPVHAISRFYDKRHS